MYIHIDSKLVPVIRQCTRCGWVDPAALDRIAEDSMKRAMPASAQRAAMAASGTPFAFVVQRGKDLTIEEGLQQAFTAVSAMGADLDSKRCTQIFQQMIALIRELQ
jgi:hypothetical protein